MKAVKNDLNFFKAYKLGPGKHAEGGMGGILALICVFVLAVALGFAAPFTLRLQAQRQTEKIREELERPEVAELQEKLNAAMNKNGLLISYLSALNTAKASFDDSKIIDSSLFNALAASMPAGTTLQSVSVTPQSVRLSCVCSRWLDPATLEQTLRTQGLFGSITYNSISGADGSYSFSMECLFVREEADAE